MWPEWNSNKLSRCPAHYETMSSLVRSKLCESSSLCSSWRRRWDQYMSTSATNMTVNAELQSSTIGGTIYCNPFFNYSISTISRSLIKSVGTSAVIKASRQSMVQHVPLVFQNLSPLTTYSVFCFVTDALGNGIDLKTVLQFRKDVQTTCCVL
jgi:hypothetical protein